MSYYFINSQNHYYMGKVKEPKSVQVYRFNDFSFS